MAGGGLASSVTPLAMYSASLAVVFLCDPGVRNVNPTPKAVGTRHVIAQSIWAGNNQGHQAWETRLDRLHDCRSGEAVRVVLCTPCRLNATPQAACFATWQGASESAGRKAARCLGVSR